ncbi:MAG: hypothetical protein J3Q66DRAFT_310181, partial [Benniella sp.]
MKQAQYSYSATLARDTVAYCTLLRSQLLVNQRHLIDKILARYSSEYVVYRELMQNADDACAKGVEIVFETASPNSHETTPDLSAKITRIIFKNNGIDFRQEDWGRLKKIAEGNPDETKIGAFGVGFYSLFSICEEPFISSGKECMAFYWREDQLFTKQAPILEKEQQEDRWTTFLLILREPMDMLNMDTFGSFIARSLGFTSKLCNVTVYLNHHQLLNINKTIRESRPMTIPNSMQTTSPLKMFTLKSADLQNVQMDATQLMISEQTREIRTIESQVFLRTASGKLDVNVSEKDAAEMERTTKKYPPKQTTLQLQYHGHDEAESKAPTDNKAIFKDLLPFPEQGRIFIGFPTHQTTGFCGHIAGRFIPTVERENLDFVVKCLRDWNHELLSMAGLLSRMVYEDELAQIGLLYSDNILSRRNSDATEDESTARSRERLENRALHALKAFRLHPSIPEPLVGSYIDAYFFKMSMLGISVLSSHGVKELDKVRIPDSTMSTFLKNLPILPISVYLGSREFMNKLEIAGKVQRISFRDVLGELESRTLTRTQMVAMLRWWVDHKSKYIVSDADTKAFLQTALVPSGNSTRPLSTFKWFVNPALGPVHMPLPPETLPYNITNTFREPELLEISSSWQQLSLHEWTTYIVKGPDFETSPEFAEEVLHVLSRGWSQIPNVSRKAIVSLLEVKKCIPTKFGMRIPKETYLKTVTLFSDLPVMEFREQPLDALLLAMGARQSVELQLVFGRLVNVGSWDHMQLVKYLTSIRRTLSPREINELRATPIFPKAGQSRALSTPQPANRHIASALYAPTETNISLGLPVIEWKGGWRETSDEAELLFDLGLEELPRMKDLLVLAAYPNEQVIRAAALQYFFDNFNILYAEQYDSSINVAFLPITDDHSSRTPLECFSNKNCSIMGFPILRQDLRVHAALLGIQENPSSDILLEKLLISPPQTRTKARQTFEYLHSVQGNFLTEEWTTLGTTKFIPLDDTGKSMVDPQSCYFFKKDSPYHRDLLITVDFGPTANLFLKACGVKDEPSPTDLAQLVARSPEKFLHHEGVHRYKSILRQIATHLHVIKPNESLLDEMKKSPFLLAEKMIDDGAAAFSSASETTMDNGQGVVGSTSLDEQDENMGQIQYRLARASDISLVDDTVLQQIFTPLCAPMEELLESLYESLGSAWISKQVKDTHKPVGEFKKTDRSYALQARIVERAPLLLNGHPASRLHFKLDWLTTKLMVLEVPEIQLRRKFVPTGVTKSEGTTACIVQDDKGVHYLLVTEQVDTDYFDIADALAKLLLKKKKLNDSIWWTNLLSSTLQNLKRKGFQVDRILNAK